MSNIYLFSIISTMLLAVLYNRSRNKKLCLGLIILMLVLISGLRVDSTLYSDEWNYRHAFQGYTNISFNALDLNILKEPGFTLLNYFIAQITDNSQVLIFLCACITNLSFVLFLYRYSNEFTFSLFLYVTGGTYFSSMNVIRQYLAIAIILFGFKYLLTQDLKRFTPFVLIAFLFHKSAVIAFIFYFLINSSLISKHKLISFLFIIFIFLNFNNLLNLLSNSGYGNYVESFSATGYGVGIIRIAFWALLYLVILLFQKAKDINSIKEKFLNCIYTSLSILIISAKYVYIARLDYFNCCSLVVIPTIPYSFREKKLVKMSLYLLFFIYGWYLTKSNNMTNILFTFI